jgi:hypothetical protein
MEKGFKGNLYLTQCSSALEPNRPASKKARGKIGMRRQLKPGMVEKDTRPAAAPALEVVQTGLRVKKQLHEERKVLERE